MDAIRGQDMSLSPVASQIQEGDMNSRFQFLGLAALSWSIAAQAQQPTAASDDTGGAPIDEVVVTGFRGSLASALEEKRATTGVVDVIKAEDVAKFPDANLAESLQRVPGVAVARDGGEGRSISVRGLGPDFTRVRLNGLEAQTTSNGFEGINRTRGFDFNVFASELFNSLTVRKSPSAETEEGSLGATVDLQTGRPFDKMGTQFAVSTKASYNDLAENTDPRFAMLASKTLLDDSFGVLFSAAYSKSEKISQASHNLNWDRMTDNGGWCNPANAMGACFGEAMPVGITPEQLTSTSIYHPRIPRMAEFGVDNERLGLTGALQWQASDSTLLSLDLLYSKHNGLRTEYLLTPIGIFRSQSQQGKPQTIIREAEVRDNNLVYAHLDNVDLRAELSVFDFSTTFKQAGFTLDHEFNDRWKATVKLGASDSDFVEPRETTLQVDRLDTQDFIWDFRESMTRPRIVWGFDTDNPANYYFGPAITSPFGGVTGPEIRLRPQAVYNEFKQGSIDLAFTPNETWTFKGGLNVRKYGFRSDAQRRQSEITLPAAPPGGVADLVRQFSGFEGFGLPPETATSWVVPDERAYIDLFDIYGNEGIFTLRRDVPAARSAIYAVDEKDSAAFLQADFKTEWFGRSVRGDVGLRYVRTEQEAEGFAEAGASTELLRPSRRYDDFLPAFNVSMDLNDEWVLRLAGSRVMTRPPLASLTPGVAANVSGGTRTVTQGNPNLDPIEADAFDLSAEWYFAPESLVSVGVFYKDVKTYIQTLRDYVQFNTLGIPDVVATAQGVSPTDFFYYSRPINSDGGPLTGVELNVQMPFSFLPGFWKDFGLLANYTHVDSDIDYIIVQGNPAATPPVAAVTAELPLINLSKETANATLYYGKGGFEARVSMSYRDSYLRIVPGLNGQDADGMDSGTYLDASASYRLNDHVQFTLEGQNLGDTYEHTFNDSVARRNEYFRNFGRQYTLGVRFNY
jgi:iron complex outermembrane receptor protein